MSFAAVVALLKGLPWRLIGLILFGLAVAGAVMYGAHRLKESGRNEGRQEIQGKWDASVERGRRAIAEQNRLNALKSAQEAASVQAAQDRQNERSRQAMADKDRLLSDLQRGTVRLRQQWAGCVSASRASEAGTAAESDAAELWGEGPQPLVGAVADQIFDADQADAEITLWQSIAVAQQQACSPNP